MNEFFYQVKSRIIYEQFDSFTGLCEISNTLSFEF